METNKPKLTMSPTHVENMPAAQTTPVLRTTTDVQHHNVLDSVSIEVDKRRPSDFSKVGRHDAKIVLGNQSGTKKTVAAICEVQKCHTTAALGVGVVLASGNVCEGQNKWDVFVKNEGYFLPATKINLDQNLEIVNEKIEGKKLVTHLML